MKAKKYLIPRRVVCQILLMENSFQLKVQRLRKEKNDNQRLKRSLSLSPPSEELPTISRPKQRRFSRRQSRSKFMITSDTNTSSSDSKTCDGKRSFVMSGAAQNTPNVKISDTNIMETFSDPDVQVLSLSSSEDSDVPLVELLERRKEKQFLSTSKSSGKSDEKGIKLNLASGKHAIASLAYLKKTLPSTLIIDEQSKDIDDDSNETLLSDTRDSDERDQQQTRTTHVLMERSKMNVKSSEDSNEDDNNKTSLKNTKDPNKDDQQRKMRTNSLLGKSKETIKSSMKDKPLAIESPSPAIVSRSSSLHQNTGKTVENFGKEINENEKNDIHEKTNQVQNTEIDTLDIPEIVLVQNKERVGADVSVKTEPSSSYTQEPECIYIEDDDDIDDDYVRSLSQRVIFIDEDDGDKEGEEEKKQYLADDEGIVEDVKVKIEMNSEGFEIKDPEFWEDYAHISEEDFDGYGYLVEPSLMHKSALGTDMKIKTKLESFNPKGDCKKVSAATNVLSSKENVLCIKKKQYFADDEGILEDVKVKIEMDSEDFEIKDPEFREDYAHMSEEDSDGHGDLVEPSMMQRSALGTEKKIKTELDSFKPEGDGEKVSAGRNVLSSKENDHSLGIKTELHSSADSGHDKEEDDGLSGANVAHS